MFEGCFRHVLRMFSSGCFRGVSGCFRYVSGPFYQCFRHVLGMFSECFRAVSGCFGMFRDRFRNVLEMF